MAISLDHVFILTAPGASEADSLLRLGFVEGNANVHPGQGTSNRRFFLPGFTLECLYVSDADEAANGAGRHLGILARSRDLHASPFGVVVRVSEGQSHPAFSSWPYVPDYFDGNLCFHVGNNSNVLEEPLCVCMPPALPPSSGIHPGYENLQWELNTLRIAVPVEKPSEVLKQFAAMDNVDMEFGMPHHMTLTFNNGIADTVVDLSPELPLTIAY